MSYYEIVCIIHPALQAGHLEDTIKQINDKIDSSKNGKMIYQENWGKKKLSYLIQKQKYGTYYIFQCMINGQFINELSDEFQHNTNIIRYLITKIDETQLMKEKKNSTNDDVVEKNKDENKTTLDKNDSAEAKIADEKNADNNDTAEKDEGIKDDDTKNDDIKDDDSKDDDTKDDDDNKSNNSDSNEKHLDDSDSSEKE